MPSGPISLHIADVLTAVPATVGVEAGLVVLTENQPPYRSLRIIIGQPEANAIHAGWQGAIPGRPSTWDLYVSTVALLGARVDRVVITSVHEERHYFAHIELEQEGERRVLACRPSDAIAVSVRAYNADIFAEPAVLDAAGVLPDGTRPGPPPAEEPPDLAEREAAVAAREAELAERERLLAQRERPPCPEPATESPASLPVSAEVVAADDDRATGDVVPTPPAVPSASAPAAPEVASESVGLVPSSAPAGPDLAPAPAGPEPDSGDPERARPATPS